MIRFDCNIHGKDVNYVPVGGRYSCTVMCARCFAEGGTRLAAEKIASRKKKLRELQEKAATQIPEEEESDG
jgi:hypothetical protein